MSRRLLIVVGVLVGLAGITWAAYAWVHAQSHVSTDDAYVESAIAPPTPVRGEGTSPSATQPTSAATGGTA